jgi:hypothetical protein
MCEFIKSAYFGTVRFGSTRPQRVFPLENVQNENRATRLKAPGESEGTSEQLQIETRETGHTATYTQKWTETGCPACVHCVHASERVRIEIETRIERC